MDFDNEEIKLIYVALKLCLKNPLIKEISPKTYQDMEVLKIKIGNNYFPKTEDYEMLV